MAMVRVMSWGCKMWQIVKPGGSTYFSGVEIRSVAPCLLGVLMLAGGLCRAQDAAFVGQQFRYRNDGSFATHDRYVGWVRTVVGPAGTGYKVVDQMTDTTEFPYRFEGMIDSNQRRHKLLGPYRAILQDGSSKVIGNYVAGKRQGAWYTYYGSGMVKDSAYYVTGLQQGIKKHYDKRGRLTATVPFEQGKPHGLAEAYDSTGRIVLRATFAKGDTVTCETVGREGLADTTACIWWREPMPVNYPAFRSRIGYPRHLINDGVEGTVAVRLVVEANGLVGRHQVVSSPHPGLTKAVLLQLPLLRFVPGIRYNQVVPTEVLLPVLFRLE